MVDFSYLQHIEPFKATLVWAMDYLLVRRNQCVTGEKVVKDVKMCT